MFRFFPKNPSSAAPRTAAPFTFHLSLLPLLRDLLRSGFGAEFVGKEREKISYVGNLLLQRAPDTMTKRVNSEQDRISGRSRSLQPGGEFEGIIGSYPTVVQSSCHEDRRVFGFIDHMLIGRVT